MTTTLNSAPDGQAVETAKSLRKLYFIRVAFSVSWVILVFLFAKKSAEIATILLIIYPAWDVFGTFMDIRANRNTASKLPQYINIAISAVTTIVIALALRDGVPMALIVFGGWAILTGLIQLTLGLRRKKIMSGQWPMIISGGQSMIGGTFTIISAHSADRGIPSLAAYVAFGAFYYLLAAYNLPKTINQSKSTT